MDVWGVGVILFTLLLGSELIKATEHKRSSLLTVIDTPWDEPTINSPEFCRYVSGTVFTEHPWQRLSTLVLGIRLV